MSPVTTLVKPAVAEVRNDALRIVLARKARLEDSESIAGLFRGAYRYSSHPCQQTQFVAAAMKRGDFWYVAEERDTVVACQGMTRHRWNVSWEFSRGVTDPNYGGLGLATALTRACLVEISEAPGDLLTGYPRTSAMHHIISAKIGAGLTTVGHDGAINVANGLREYHLVSAAMKPPAAFRHRIPRAPSLANTPFVAREVMGRIGLKPEPGPYPAELIAGSSAAAATYGPLRYHYHAACPSRSLEITACENWKASPAAVAAEIDRLAAFHPEAVHLRLAVMVDKTDLIAELRKRRFTATAYLPAWHTDGGTRFDCVLMVRRRDSAPEPVDHGVREWIDRFDEGLNR